jgi:PAS domain S-box-containing protein
LQSSNYWRTLFEVTERDIVLLYALISLNFFAFIVFGFILLRSVLKLVRERRALTLGAKMKTRLLFYFTAISILPIFAMGLFTYLFMNRALDRWFTQIPETVAREARDIRDRANIERGESSSADARMLAAALEGREIDDALLKQVAAKGSYAFIAVSDGGKVVRSAVSGDGPMDPEAIAAAVDTRADGASPYSLFTAPLSDGRTLILASKEAGSGAVGQMIEDSLQEYSDLKLQQNAIRQIGLLTLGILTFLLIFASSWMAFYVSRGLTTPIMALAKGADRVAKGELGYQVDTIAEDELDTLVNAFNQMSAKLKENADELNESRRYIETVVNTLPTGVISLDARGKVTTINPAAVEILRIESGDLCGAEIATLVSSDDRQALERIITRAKRVGYASEQSKLRPQNGNGEFQPEQELTVALTASALPENSGVVLVIEDLSELISAQRASAWREVARRMAHEIKNPLTPIQLSAERIAKRFRPSEKPAVVAGVGTVQTATVDDLNSMMVAEGTDTIIREVQSLKAMVDEFSQFARLPNVELAPGSVNDVIEQAATLYLDRHDEVRLETRIDPDVPKTKIDAEQLKRAIVNLIDNAIEAPSGDESKIVSVSSVHDTTRDQIVIEVSDNGKGIEPADFQKLFQPYFSTKGRGTGLGLAIVYRIVADHNGKIRAVPNRPNGARFVIELPVAN